MFESSQAHHSEREKRCHFRCHFSQKGCARTPKLPFFLSVRSVNSAPPVPGIRARGVRRGSEPFLYSGEDKKMVHALPLLLGMGSDYYHTRVIRPDNLESEYQPP